MKTALFLGFGVLLWVYGAPTRIQTLKKSVLDFLSKIRISGSSPPQATKRASQFQRPFLRRKGRSFEYDLPLPHPPSIRV